MLDWLAQDFVSNGWNVKRLMKMLVTSSAYRQHSRFTPQLLEMDPDNRLLARGSRNRLMGEFIRDQALAISGLLVNKIGGPSVKPYHPPGLYEQVTAQGGVNTYVKTRARISIAAVFTPTGNARCPIPRCCPSARHFARFAPCKDRAATRPCKRST
jgi:hypothetical protein